MKLQTTTEAIKNNLGLLIVCLGFAGTIFSFGSDWKGLPSRLEKIEKDRVSDKEILIRIDERVKRLESLIIEGNKRQVELMRQGSNIVVSNPSPIFYGGGVSVLPYIIHSDEFGKIIH